MITIVLVIVACIVIFAMSILATAINMVELHDIKHD